MLKYNFEKNVFECDDDEMVGIDDDTIDNIGSYSLASDGAGFGKLLEV